MLQHRYEKRYAVTKTVTVKLLLPRRLAAVAKLINISASGMALATPLPIPRNTLLKIQYEPQGGRAYKAPALVIYNADGIVGLMLSFTSVQVRRRHATLLASCLQDSQRPNPGTASASGKRQQGTVNKNTKKKPVSLSTSVKNTG